MKITKVSKSVVFYITTDDDDLFEYKRYSSNNWTVSMGESDEPVYDCEDLEEMFQKWIINKVDLSTGDLKAQCKEFSCELVTMLENLPQNRPLYKDSGLWQVRTDDMEDVIFQQGVNESFFNFIKRVYDKENSFMELNKKKL